jgi:lipid-binding SYLF domain-containing protein
MKTIILSLIFAGLAVQGFAQDRMQLEERIQTLDAKFDALQHAPDKCIPPDLLAKAKGVVLLDRVSFSPMKAGTVWPW